MEPTADDKKYATDMRKWSQGVVQDGYHDIWQESPISDMLSMKDVCVYKPGDVNKNGKEGKTSWDSFSYALLMGHNVYMHLTAVQEANRRFDAGEYPAMMRRNCGDYEYFKDIVESIFAAPDKASAMAIIEKPAYANETGYWNQIIGTRGLKGKKTVNANSQYNILFEPYDESAGE